MHLTKSWFPVEADQWRGDSPVIGSRNQTRSGHSLTSSSADSICLFSHAEWNFWPNSASRLEQLLSSIPKCSGQSLLYPWPPWIARLDNRSQVAANFLVGQGIRSLPFDLTDINSHYNMTQMQVPRNQSQVGLLAAGKESTWFRMALSKYGFLNRQYVWTYSLAILKSSILI